MSTNDDFRAEVSNGYLLIAIKIQTSTCTACGTIYVPTVDTERVKQCFEAAAPIDFAFSSPWCDGTGWKFINTDGRHALVCAACAAPFTEAERAGQAAVDIAAREICKKIDARSSR